MARGLVTSIIFYSATGLSALPVEMHRYGLPFSALDCTTEHARLELCFCP
jgi:hypothetical protein